jgi:hypothetical protein
VSDDGTDRVTNPGRFRVLHRVAATTLNDLERRYAVSRVRLVPVARDFGFGYERVERLVPLNAECAPLTIGYSSFPGIDVRYGRWYAESFPHCGCDYCDDDVDELAANFQTTVRAVVTEGFSEVRSGEQYAYTFSNSRGERSYHSHENPPGADLPPCPDGGWQPWPSAANG